MSEIIYKKVGRRYVPVALTDAYMRGALGLGFYLLEVHAGGSRLRPVLPDLAGFEAAANVAEKAMIDAMRRADAGRLDHALNESPKTVAKRKRAYKAYVAIAGDESLRIRLPSHQEVVEAAIQAVRAAYQENK